MTVDENRRMVDVYRNLAGKYDIVSNRLYVVGQRTMAYKHLAVQQLDLKPGDTVVDAGCGTGHNLPLLSKAVGPTGRVIGVDLTDAMLARADDRVRQHGLTNVTLQEADLTRFVFPKDTAGIIACFSLTLIREFDTVIQHGFDALAPGGRFVALDYKLPRWWPNFAVPAIGPMVAPFGGTLEMVRRKPFEEVARHAETMRMLERYFGWVYVAVGVAGKRSTV
ncbi:class I SAM-dependent methyltransferase [Actinoplanes hulinensis]|uniref:Class I SAM-dependent methyltransferase n=1 Tax=Actinoplanes hulinensis TaxID=1144547 RepID=A0ABS7B7N6_9ACTN|nr:methyltransferase domain-containing protein [Actinoplanes hulinensis]MBW6437068.1 class I SAM-dependent methyltransferase [Actinoplanes hulinensis]